MRLISCTDRGCKLENRKKVKSGIPVSTKEGNMSSIGQETDDYSVAMPRAMVDSSVGGGAKQRKRKSPGKSKSPIKKPKTSVKSTSQVRKPKARKPAPKKPKSKAKKSKPKKQPPKSTQKKKKPNKQSKPKTKKKAKK